MSGGLAAAGGGQPGKAKQACSDGQWHSTEARSRRKHRELLPVPLAAGWEPSCGRISPASAGLWSRRTTARQRPEAPLGPSGPTPAPAGPPCAAPRPDSLRRSPRRRPQHLSGQSVLVLHHPQGKKKKVLPGVQTFLCSSLCPLSLLALAATKRAQLCPLCPAILLSFSISTLSSPSSGRSRADSQQLSCPTLGLAPRGQSPHSSRRGVRLGPGRLCPGKSLAPGGSAAPAG